MSDDLRALTRSGADTSLVDLLDTVIERGVIVSGDVVLSVADVDLVHLGLRLALTGLDRQVEGSTGGEHTGGRRSAPAIDDPSRADAIAPASARGSDADREERTYQDLGSDLTAGFERLVESGRRGEASSEDVQRGLAALVLTVVELLRELMERQALRRMRGGTVTEDEVERLGQTFIALRERMEELKEAFGLEDDDLNLDLGPLGRLR